MYQKTLIDLMHDEPVFWHLACLGIWVVVELKADYHCFFFFKNVASSAAVTNAREPKNIARNRT